jgi:hypothetical protein
LAVIKKIVEMMSGTIGVEAFTRKSMEVKRRSRTLFHPILVLNDYLYFSGFLWTIYGCP